jgi:hypothetical protein
MDVVLSSEVSSTAHMKACLPISYCIYICSLFSFRITRIQNNRDIDTGNKFFGVIYVFWEEVSPRGHIQFFGSVFFFSMARQPFMGLGLLVFVEVSRSHI